jgi:peroxiredoxin Q/BCP
LDRRLHPGLRSAAFSNEFKNALQDRTPVASPVAYFVRASSSGSKSVMPRPKNRIIFDTMKTLLVLLLWTSGLVGTLLAASSKETNGRMKLGDPIPVVTSTDQNGKSVDLAQVAKVGYTLVYFYPKAMTPGCTAQACSLRDSYTELQEKGVKVFGVSLDSVEAQKEFEQKEHLPFQLLSDADRQVTSAFGVPLQKNAFATRQAYLFKDGKLVWLDTKASTDKQAQDVLAALGNH